MNQLVKQAAKWVQHQLINHCEEEEEEIDILTACPTKTRCEINFHFV